MNLNCRMKFLFICISAVIIGQNNVNSGSINKEEPTSENLPQEFPSDTEKYNFVQNNGTLLDRLKHEDGLQKPETPTTENADYYTDYDEEELKKEVEDIQDNKRQPGDPELEEQFNRREGKLTDNQPDDIVIDGIKPLPELSNNHVVGIVATGVVIMCVAVYASLLVFRRKLEHRYGMRQRLTTSMEEQEEEDEFNNGTDVRDINVL